MAWRHRPASLLQAAESLRPPISSPPQRRSAGGFERLPGPRRRPWLTAATLTTCRGYYCRHIRWKKRCASKSALQTLINEIMQYSSINS